MRFANYPNHALQQTRQRRRGCNRCLNRWPAISRFAAIAVFAVAFSLAGCRPPTANPRVVGTYVATNGESLMFLPDTRVLHVVPQPGGPQQFQIGYTRPVLGKSNAVEIWQPDRSPFLGTQFEIDTNFTKIKVRWDDPRPNPQTRQTFFERKD